MLSAPVLHLLDFAKPFVVECDTSGSGIGVVLHQGVGPLAFFSQPLATRHMGLPAYERELIGLVQAVRHRRAYLWGQPFMVRTDHYSLKFLLDQRLSTIPQHRWVSKLIGFDFSVEFKPDRTNVVADALSRCNEESAPSVAALSRPTFEGFEAVRHEVQVDHTLQQLQDDIVSGKRGELWSFDDSLIFKGRRVFVLASSPALPNILVTTHIGHKGVERTLHRLRADFEVPGTKKVVADFIRNFTTCQRNNIEHLHPAGLLQSLLVLRQHWEDIAMDFVEGLPRVNGKSVIPPSSIDSPSMRTSFY